jgi:hypothetical protein
MGTHAGMFIGATLYDPGGNYLSDRLNSLSGEERDNFHPTLNDYVNDQSQNGSDIRVYRYDLLPADISTILRRTDENPGAILYCANAVQSCIAGVGPFKNIWTPWSFTMTFPSSLANRLQSLTTGSCTNPSGGKC